MAAGSDHAEPESGKGSHGGWDQVAETSQAYVAELMALRLRGAGIEAQVVDQTFKQEPLPNVRAFAVVRVLVPSERAPEAREILASSAALPEDVLFDEAASGDREGGPEAGQEPVGSEAK